MTPITNHNTTRVHLFGSIVVWRLRDWDLIISINVINLLYIF